MSWRGGPVQTSPRIYLVLWGNSWTTTGDPNGVANRLHYFYDGVGGSSMANVLKQYGGVDRELLQSHGSVPGLDSRYLCGPHVPDQS